MSLKVLIVAHFAGKLDGSDNNRFNYIAETLATQGADVTLATSSFHHVTKRQRDDDEANTSNYKVVYISEPSYKKNVSIKRYVSHTVFASNLRKYLKEQKTSPDVIYVAVPSVHAANVCRCYAKERCIPFLVDVQDLWPEAFFMLRYMKFFQFVTKWMLSQKVNKVYRSADAIVGVSQTYVERALRVGDTSRKSKVIYLGTDISYFDSLIKPDIDSSKRADSKSEEKDHVINIVYLGTLGHSYDLETGIKAISLASDLTSISLKLVVIGDGPLHDKFRSLAAENNINAEFLGRLNYECMVRELAAMDVALNVISKGAAQSIINKHADYAAASLPVISTQENPEYRNLLSQFNAGINCGVSDHVAVANEIVRLAESSELRKELGEGSRLMAEALFDRKQTYKSILPLIDSLK